MLFDGSESPAFRHGEYVKHSEFDTPTPGPLIIVASGDPDYPFCVCPVDSDGIQLPPVAQFEKHADALLFVTMNRGDNMLYTFGDNNVINKIVNRYISNELIGYNRDYTQTYYRNVVEWTDGTTQTVYEVHSNGELYGKPRYLYSCPLVEVSA